MGLTREELQEWHDNNYFSGTDERNDEAALKTFYFGDIKNEIAAYIKAEKIFNDSNFQLISKWIDGSFNILKFVIDKHSKVYESGVVRGLVTSDNKPIETREVFDKVYNQYGFENKMSLLNRMTNLFGISFVRVMYDGEVKVQIITPDKCYYEFDSDRLILFGFVYKVIKEGEQEAVQEWRIDENDDVVYRDGVATNSNGKYIFMESSEDIVYKNYRNSSGKSVLPFVPSYAEELPNGTIKNAGHNANIIRGARETSLLMSLGNMAYSLSVFKRAYIAGEREELDKIGKIFDNLNLTDVIKVGRGDSDIQVGRMSYDIDFEKMNSFIESKISRLLSMHHISPSSWRYTGSPTSGISIKLENSGLIEKRQSQIPNYQRVEYDLWETIKAVVGAHSSKVEDGYLTISFGEMSLPVSDLERGQANALAISNGTKSVVEIIAEERGITTDEAEQIYNKNLSYQSGGALEL